MALSVGHPRGTHSAGLKCRSHLTGQVTGYRPQATGHRPQATGQVTGHVTGQITGHRSQVTGHKSGQKVTQKTIGHWRKLFWTDILLYKNKISQGTLMIFLSFKQY